MEARRPFAKIALSKGHTPVVTGSMRNRLRQEGIEAARVKQMARRAAWLGNDETHYSRKWEDKDLHDLKKVLELTTDWISMEELTKSVIAEMPEGKK